MRVAEELGVRFTMVLGVRSGVELIRRGGEEVTLLSAQWSPSW